MFGGLATLARMSVEERAALGDTLLRYWRPPGEEAVPEAEQCVNCFRRAGASGWCAPCWAEVDPTGQPLDD